MEQQSTRRKRRKTSLKQREDAPLYFNSQLNQRLLQPSFQQFSHRYNSSERCSPDLKSLRVKFSPSDKFLYCNRPDSDNSPEKSYSHSSKASPQIDSSVTPTSSSPQTLKPILKKPSFRLRVLNVPHTLSTSSDVSKSASPSKRLESPTKHRILNSSYLDTLGKMTRELSPENLEGLRGNIAKCRTKIRQFYMNMSRLASLTDEEVREEMQFQAERERLSKERRRTRVQSMRMRSIHKI